MPAKVVFTVVQGNLAGKQFLFSERTTCIIGRAEDCNLQVPNDNHHEKISRHHCMLDINPPDVRVRDFGSLNGTYVNGSLIGQREGGMTPEQGAQLKFREYDLKDGDEIKLEDTVFSVSIFVPTFCTECAREIPEEYKAGALLASDIYQCAECREVADRTKLRGTLTKRARVCAGCGRDAEIEPGENRQGVYLCPSCRENPTQRIESLLEAANGGGENLLALQGYQIQRKLGCGGMGCVYLASHIRTGNSVALKVMLPQVAVDEYAKQAFMREAENTRALKHRNVVALLDWGFSNGTYFFTLEFCSGGSVDHLMKARGGKLSVREASEIILQALDGLEYAHNAPIPYVKLKDGGFVEGRGLVHRDIKPANILLTGSDKQFVAKVGDYGLAKAFDMAGLSGQTRTGALAGTPYFMARQQVLNFRYVKPGVDVWAMAASLYNMLTGNYPRDFPSGKDWWQIVVQSDAMPIRSRDSSIPKQLADVIDTALRDRPHIQFETAAAFKRALESVL